VSARNVRTRLGADARRRAIVESARRVVAERGLDGVSVREIAAAAEVSVGTVTHHFAGLDEILAGVLKAESQQLRDRLVEAIAERSSALEGLDRLNNSYLVDRPEVRAFWSLWLASCARAPRDSQLADWLWQRYATWRGIVRDLLVEGVEAGEFEVADPEGLAVELVALLDGYGIQVFFDPGPPDVEEARAALRVALRRRLDIR
jgi:AcrR family transcriptional regulator